ncbi:hypothetical protein KXR83_00415 [Williamsia muralis]|uniref:SMI1/KNR4 family protein n=1 Tax=Williamsia marianensis TaxID=85044 RepID=UPI003F177926
MSVTAHWSALLETIHKTPSRTLTFRPAAAASEIERAEASTGATWPGELREFYSLQAGRDADDLGELLPQSELFGLERLLYEHSMMVELGQQMIAHDPEYYSLEGATGPAGAEAGVFLPAYIPISGADGWLFYCDTRAGDNYGCIRQWDKYEADTAGPSWHSLTDMLTALRISITENSQLNEFSGSAGWWPHNYDGQLTWSPGGPGDA